MEEGNGEVEMKRASRGKRKVDERKRRLQIERDGEEKKQRGIFLPARERRHFEDCTSPNPGYYTFASCF